MPDDLAEHDVGAVAVGHRDHAFERLGAQVVVGVAEEDVAAGGVLDADVARPPGAAGAGDADDLDAALVVGGVEVEQFVAAVGRSVVDDDDLLSDPLDQRGGRGTGRDMAAVVGGMMTLTSTASSSPFDTPTPCGRCSESIGRPRSCDGQRTGLSRPTSWVPI